MKVKSENEVAQSCLTLATPWTAAYQAPPPMGFSRQEDWSGLPLPTMLGMFISRSGVDFIDGPFFFRGRGAVITGLGEGNDNPLQYSCLENSIDRGVWQATVHVVTVRHD